MFNLLVLCGWKEMNGFGITGKKEEVLNWSSSNEFTTWTIF